MHSVVNINKLLKSGLDDSVSFQDNIKVHMIRQGYYMQWRKVLSDPYRVCIK